MPTLAIHPFPSKPSNDTLAAHPAIAVPLALALPSCSHCHGFGKSRGRGGLETCLCVYRQVFRDCMARVHRMRSEPLEMARRPALRRSTSGSRLSYCFPNVEFAADLENSAKRILETRELLVWKYHYLQDLEWRECVSSVGRDLGRPIDRGEFFHAAYRMERQLGRAWLELRMWPRDYFAGDWYMIDELLATPRGSQSGGIGASQHCVLDTKPAGWDKRKQIDPHWVEGDLPAAARRKGATSTHPLSEQERQLSERVDAWMVV